MCNNQESGCIAEILKVICVLQQNANCGDACLDTYDSLCCTYKKQDQNQLVFSNIKI